MKKIPCQTRKRLMWLGVMLAGLLAPALPGCPGGSNESADPPFGAMPPGSPFAATDGEAVQTVPAVRAAFSVIELPVGMAGSSEEIWNLIDEKPIRAVGSASLKRNGFRIGVGRKDTWKDLAKVIRRMTGQQARQAMLSTLPGRPISIVLKTAQPAQTIFLSHDDGTLSGADYPSGDNLLVLGFTINEDDKSRVVVTAVPQIRSAKRRTRYVKTAGGYAIVDTPSLFSLDPLTFQLVVKSGEYLVIGPGAGARRRTSAAFHFLAREKKGLEYETVLILAPKVFTAAVRAPREQPPRRSEGAEVER